MTEQQQQQQDNVTYLGDGVYAVFDGYGISLDLRAQEPTRPITRIYLEPQVLDAFDRFRRRCGL